MRDLNECKAEIFRRSNERIKERKKIRNRVLAWCIPLCLCITVWSVTILPAVMPAGRDKVLEAEGEGVDKTDENLVTSFAEVEIRDAGSFPAHYRKSMDKNEITGIYCTILDMFPAADAEQAVNEDNRDNADDFQDANAEEETGYVITFTDADGFTLVYTLNGNELWDEGSNNRVYLSADQLGELKTVLGLTQ